MVIREVTYQIGIGMVLRDSDGTVLITLMKPAFYHVEPMVAEAKGLIEAITLCSILVYKMLFLR